MVENRGRRSQAADGGVELALQPRGCEVLCLDQVSNILSIQYRSISCLLGESNKSSKPNLTGRIG